MKLYSIGISPADYGDLYQSGHIGERDRQKLKELGISVEVNLEPYPNDLRVDPETYLYIHWPLRGLPKHPEILKPLAAFLGILLRKKQNVLVHCTHGRNRSSLVIALILKELGFPLETGYNMVMERNPGASFVKLIKSLS